LRRAWLAYALAAALFAGGFLAHGQRALAQSAKTTLTDPAQAERFNDISDQLVCQCSCQMILRVCNHQNCPSAVPMRREIERQMLAGETDEVIVASFVDEYGLKILSSPPAEGFNLAAWVMPGFALLVGLFFIVHFASQWASRRRIVNTRPAPAIDPEMRERMERELKSLER
jgi:cytochrome c-type biogenesis protein CcmH